MEIKSKSYYSFINPYPITSLAAVIFTVLLLFLIGITVLLMLEGDNFIITIIRMPILLLLFFFLMCFARIKINEDGISYFSLFKRVKYKWTDIKKTGAIHCKYTRIDRYSRKIEFQILSREELQSKEFSAWLYITNDANKTITRKLDLNTQSDFILFKYNANALDLIEYYLLANNIRFNWTN